MLNNKENNQTSKFSIVRAISAFLKLGDDGKLDSFFTRIIKTLSKEVCAHKKNLDNLRFNHDLPKSTYPSHIKLEATS